MKAEDEVCPICGYYCLDDGGEDCIDKPGLIKNSEKVKIITDKCQNCGDEVKIVDGYTYFGIICPKCTGATKLLQEKGAK